ncbi:MAG: hypothetical protein H6608_00875 [Flavobacteriales bacterium]|nr:hypothetical protein [Bacteroidota bacterium]MCB9239659.1 hypothetical protein [Flavobacteriales bacterium]
MKFRRLKKQELESARQEFLAFLAVNGITAEMWEEIKTQEHLAADLIDQFSEVFFQSYLEKVQYVDVRMKDELYCFHYQSSMVQLAHLSLQEELDWEQAHSLTELSDRLARGEGTITIQSKNYNPNRELEIFRMLEQGGRVSDGAWFKELVLAFARQN